MTKKNYSLQYFAILKERAGMDGEEFCSSAATPRELYGELKAKRDFSLLETELRVAVNGDFADFDQTLSDGDEIAFIPPVSGG